MCMHIHGYIYIHIHVSLSIQRDIDKQMRVYVSGVPYTHPPRFMWSQTFSGRQTHIRIYEHVASNMYAHVDKHISIHM